MRMKRAQCLWLALACLTLAATPALANPIAEVARPEAPYQLAFLLLITFLEAGVLYLLLRPPAVITETFVANLASYAVGLVAFFVWACFTDPLDANLPPFTFEFRSHYLSVAAGPHGAGLLGFLLASFALSVLVEGAYFWWRWRDHRGWPLAVGVVAANVLSYGLFAPLLAVANATGYFLSAALGLAVLEGAALSFLLRPRRLWLHVAAANLLSLATVFLAFEQLDEANYLLPVLAGYAVKALYLSLQWGDLGRFRVTSRALIAAGVSALVVVGLLLPALNPFEVDRALRFAHVPPLENESKHQRQVAWTDRQQQKEFGRANLPLRLREDARRP